MMIYDVCANLFTFFGKMLMDNFETMVMYAEIAQACSWEASHFYFVEVLAEKCSRHLYSLGQIYL